MPDRQRPRLLFVDDEPEVLSGVMRNLRSENFEVMCASDGTSALEKVRTDGPFAVVFTDWRMPGMDGPSLLRALRVSSPNTVRVLSSHPSDLELGVNAINEGLAFRFVPKPCTLVLLAFTVKAAVEQHRLLTLEQRLLEGTYMRSMKAMMDILALAAPSSVGPAQRVRRRVAALAGNSLGAARWQVELAAMLSLVGNVTLPAHLLERLDKGEPLEDDELEQVRNAVNLPMQLLDGIPRLGPVIEMLRFQTKNFDGSGLPAGHVQGEAIPWGARALRAVRDLDALESQGSPLVVAIDTLRRRQGVYDPVILDALAALPDFDPSQEVREVPLTQLAPGMVLAQDLRTSKGMLFVSRGQEVTSALLDKIHGYSGSFISDKLVRVIIRDPVRACA